MFIFKDTKRRANPESAYVDAEGTKYPKIPRDLLEEIPDPVRESDETHYCQEIDEAPYLICTPKSPEQLAALRWSKIKQIRDDLTLNGGCYVADKWFHTDAFSKQQQMALAMLGANLPTGIQWKTMDGSFIELTPAIVNQLFLAQIAREQSLFAHAEVLKANTDDINSGWPARYEAAP